MHKYFIAAFVCVSFVTAHAEIYQWVDERGKVHFGDKPPDEVKQAVTDLTERYAIDRDFEVSIVPHDYQMGLDVKTKVTVAVSKIFSIYAADFIMRPDTDARLEIRIYGIEQEFRALTRERGLQIENASGFYSPRENTIHVWRNRNLDRLLEVLTHEASHTIMQHQIGRVPIWINEGLAEYFETMEVFGQTVVVRPNTHWIATVDRLLRDGLMPLGDFLSMTREKWYLFNGEGSLAYAVAWSVTFFLMSSEPGIATIHTVLQHHKQGGEEDVNALIAAAYPGGFEAFEEAWRYWAMYGKRVPHRY